MEQNNKKSTTTHSIGIYLWIWGLLFVFSTFSYMVDWYNFQGLLRSLFKLPHHNTRDYTKTIRANLGTRPQPLRIIPASVRPETKRADIGISTKTALFSK